MEVGGLLEGLLEGGVGIFTVLILVWLPSLLMGLVMFILRIIAAVRISKFGGSGVGYFFLGWFYVLLSDVADGWKGFNKTHAVLASFFPLGCEIYTLVKLK